MRRRELETVDVLRARLRKSYTEFKQARTRARELEKGLRGTEREQIVAEALYYEKAIEVAEIAGCLLDWERKIEKDSGKKD